MAKCKLIRSSIPAEITFKNLHRAWTNPSPTSSFASQQITLDISACPNYDFVKIRFAQNKNSTASRLTAETEKGKGSLLNYSAATGSGVRTFSRGVTYVDATHLSFGDCTYATGTTADTTNNDSCIPIEIYIGKYDLTAIVNAIASSVKTNAQNCMMSDGVTSVESEITTLKSADVKRVTLTKSTNSEGYFQLAKSTYPHPISAIATSPSCSLVMHSATSSAWAVWAESLATFSKLTNTSITFDLYYTD